MPEPTRIRVLLYEVYVPVAEHSAFRIPATTMRALIDDLDIAAIVRPCATTAEASRRLSAVVETLMRWLMYPARIP